MINGTPAVLIVDDEQAICELLCEALAQQGYACQSVSNAEDALSRLKETDFDIALLDMKMPGMSGMDLLSRISESYRDTSVLMITAANDLNTSLEAMQKGARDYILKPFSIEEIRARVGEVLRESALHHDKSPANAGGPSASQAETDAIWRSIQGIG